MQFLSGTEIQREVNDLVTRDGDVSIAVAYWGHDAVDRTGIAHKQNGNLRILCYLLSGSCNPFPIEVLRTRKIPVRTLKLLHAKVWINGSDVILGSANASMYGLPTLSDEPGRSRLEANLMVQDEEFARTMQAWFDEQWEREEAQVVDDEHLRCARKLWRRKRERGDAGHPENAAEHDRPDSPDMPGNFSGLRLVAHEEREISEQARQFHTHRAREYFSDDEWRRIGDDLPFYEWDNGRPGWSGEDGTVVLDFSRRGAGDDFDFNGLLKVKANSALQRNVPNLTLLTRERLYKGHWFSPREIR